MVTVPLPSGGEEKYSKTEQLPVRWFVVKQ